MDSPHEVRLRFVGFGEAITLHIEDLSYSDPSLLIFNGYQLGGASPVDLIRRVSQMSIARVKLPRINTGIPEMGFAARLHERRISERTDHPPQDSDAT